MDYPLGVGVTNGFKCLLEEFQDLTFMDPIVTTLQIFIEGNDGFTFNLDAWDEFLPEPVISVRLPEVIHCHEPGVTKVRHDTSLVSEVLQGLLILKHMLVDQLEGMPGLQNFVLHLVDLAHASLSKELDHLVLSERVSGIQGVAVVILHLASIGEALSAKYSLRILYGSQFFSQCKWDQGQQIPPRH